MKLYVNPTGAPHEDGAYATLAAAYAEAERLLKNGEQAVDVVLRSGIHRVEKEILIDGGEMPKNAALSFVGEDGTVITTAKDIAGASFTKVEGTPYYSYTLPESEKDENGEYPAFRDLFMNGEPLRLARSSTDCTMAVDSCRHAEKNGFNAADRLLYIDRDALGDIELADNGDVIGDLEFWIKTEWQVHCVHIENVASEPSCVLDGDGKAMVAARVRKADWEILLPSYYSRLNSYPYWFANNKALMMTAGDFFYHRDVGTVYVYPRGDMKDATVSYPLSERIFHLENARNISFRNLTLREVTVNYITRYGYVTGQGGYLKIIDPATGERFGFLPYGAIYGKNVDRIRIEGCRFLNLGDDGVNFRGGVSHLTVNGCFFKNIGGSAIRLGMNTNEYSDTVYNRDINITDNYIENTGTSFPSNTSILIASVLRLELSHNTLLRSNYSAISVGWSWANRADADPAEVDTESFVNVKEANIAYNYIEDFMTGMADGGAIYVLGGNATKGFAPYLNSMNNNYIVVKENVARGGTAWTVLYHDSGASHWDDYDNVLIVERGMRPPRCTYISYQLFAMANHNRTRGLYIVGYPEQDYFEGDSFCEGYNDPTFKTLTGVHVVAGRHGRPEWNDGYRYDYDPATARYDLYRPLTDKEGVIMKDIYLYGNIDEDARIPHEKLRAIADNAGSRGAHPVYKQP